jgi:hypothetical protein
MCCLQRPSECLRALVASGDLGNDELGRDLWSPSHTFRTVFVRGLNLLPFRASAAQRAYL